MKRRILAALLAVMGMAGGWYALSHSNITTPQIWITVGVFVWIVCMSLAYRLWEESR